MSFNVLNAAGATTTFQDVVLGNATHVMQSIPTDANGGVAWGTAGSPSTSVMSFQGIAGMVPMSIGNATVSVALTTAAVAASAWALPVAVSPNGLNLNGQATMSASAPVVIASDQSTLPFNLTQVSGTTTLLGSGGFLVNLNQVAGTSVPVGSGVQATAPRVTLATDSPGIVTLGNTTTGASVPVTMASNQGSIGSLSSQYPSGATAITISQTGNTAAVAAALPGVSGKTTYISGFVIGAIATLGTAGIATITGTISTTLNFLQNVGGTTGGINLTIPFNPAIPASAASTAITVTSIAAGTGGTTIVTAYGYQL